MPVVSLRRMAIGLLSAILAVSALGVVLPLLSDVYWAFELPGHFRAQYAVASLVATFGFVVLRSGRGTVAGAGLSALVAAPVAGLWIAIWALWALW